METKVNRRELAAIYRQEIIQDISLFTSQSALKFYQQVFDELDIELPQAKTGRPGFPKAAMLRAAVVMKCEGFSQGSEIADYLDSNRLIAHYCGFDIMKPLPSQWTFTRFLRETENAALKDVFAGQVRRLYELGIIDASFPGLDSTPNMANTKFNNPKSFGGNKFSKDNPPRSDRDCRLGVHSASNQYSEKRTQFYWGYKNHVLVDCISGLPLFEMTTPANVADSTAAIPLLDAANGVIPLRECTFIADKGYDAKAIYNHVHDHFEGDCVIPLNTRNTKDLELLPIGVPLCEAGLAMNRDGKCTDRNRTKQKFCCPFKLAGHCPCDHPKFFNGKKHRGCTKYVTIPDDLRLSIDRDNPHFKRVYALRSECERYNSRLKATGQERLWVRNGNSAANLNTIAAITMLAVALTAVKSGSRFSYRAIKTAKRSA